MPSLVLPEFMDIEGLVQCKSDRILRSMPSGKNALPTGYNHLSTLRGGALRYGLFSCLTCFAGA
jgi:hypothetical protein